MAFWSLSCTTTYKQKPLSIETLSMEIDSRAKAPMPSPEAVSADPSGGRPFDLRDGWNVYELQIVALYNNPDLKAARDKIDVAHGLLISAGKLPNPVISDSTVLESVRGGAPSISLNIFQTIITGGKRRIAQEEASAEIAEAHAAVESREWDVTREVVGFYWRLRYREERIRLEEMNVALAEQSLAIAKARLDSGDTTPLDFELAASELATRRARQETLRAESVVGLQELMRLLGLPPSTDILWERQEDLYGPPNPVPAVSELEALALASRPDIREVRRRYEVAEKNLKLAYAGAIPNVDVGPAVEKSQKESLRLGGFLGIDLPIFYQNQGEIAQAAAARERVRHEVEGLILRAKQEIGSAGAKASAFDRAAGLYATEVIPKLESAVARAQAAYRAGQLGAVELIAIQQSLIRARADALDLLASRKDAIVTLTTVVGTELGKGSGP